MVDRTLRTASVSSVVGVAFAATLVLLAVFAFPTAPARTSTSSSPAPPNGSAVVPVVPSETLSQLLGSPRVPVVGAAANAPVVGSHLVPSAANSTIPLLLTLAFENASRLSAFLSAVEDPASPQYHRYLSASAFTSEFAPNASAYASIVEYLGSFGVGSLTSFPDRLAVSFSATPTTADRIFQTEVERLSAPEGDYWAAASPPMLPAALAGEVLAVGGLGPGSLPAVVPLARAEEPHASGASPGARAESGNTSLAPVTIDSVQYLYPADLQTAYDEESLFSEYGYPRGVDVAALVWAGAYYGNATAGCGASIDPGEVVGAFDPADLTSYFDNATPNGEPTTSVVAVPIDGSPPSGCLASWDTTGVVASNTAQLEAIGSMIPGATVYGVAAPGPSVSQLEASLGEVLSPPSGLPAPVRSGLQNVSVIEVGWATTDTPDAVWVSDLEQAAARGVSVVAATGDSGDNQHSAGWFGTDAGFPATAGNGGAGSLAVGGLTVTLNAANDQLASEVVWNVSTADVADGGPAGTSGGISALYSEPGYQKNTSANAVLKGAGRGVPDVAAVANNTLLTLTVDGSRYAATNATNGGKFRYASGTGLASAVVAGLLAEIDHALQASNNSALGFVDPGLYVLAEEAYTPPPTSGQVTSTPTGSYDSELPTAPFHDVVTGGNDLYRAGVGYDLASGWGSLDAYNFTMYVLHVPTAGVYGDLAGVRDRLRLAGLGVTSQRPPASVDRTYNATIQQDFFLANSLGAPVYGVQSEVYLAHTLGGLWAMNFTANLTFPFAAFSPSNVVHEVWWQPSGEEQRLPVSLAMTTTLEPANGTAPPMLLFTFGNPPASPTFTLNVPGAAFIIGRTGYSYSWQGTTWTDGPKNGASAPGFLAPQFLLVGAPPNWTGHFSSATSGTVNASVEPAGSSVFSPAASGLVTVANTQSAATALGVLWAPSGAGGFDFYSSTGATDQGLYEVEAPYFPVEFTQTGTPDGATWYVNLSNGVDLAAAGGTSSVSTALQNGTYGWVAAIDLKNWSSNPSAGSVTVAGKPQTVVLAFGPSASFVTFRAKGPEKGGALAFVWYVNISGQPSHAGTATSYQTNLTFGTYNYTVTCANSTFVASKAIGSFVAGPAPVLIEVTFVVRTYEVEFVFHLPKSSPSLTITLGGVSGTGVFSTWGLEEPKGSYAWSVTGLPFGYGAIPDHGTVHVNGPVTPIDITISTSGWGPFGLGVSGYILVGAIVGVPAVWFTVFLWRRSRRRRREGAARAREPSAGNAPRPEHGPPAPRASPDRSPGGSRAVDRAER
ncbi:MAG TPA: protease pro-enzyme activation domain-containing protein [Thermoplasmata archaeon]|nr:protease pro-enzyme activation domain-containing protein [Thermoplasmata archaeon]